MSYVGVDTNISQQMLSQARADSGRVDQSVYSIVSVGGLNVPQYPVFPTPGLPDATKESALSGVSGNHSLLVGAAIAGFLMVWLIR